MKKSNKISIAIIVLFILLITIGSTYAYFSASVSGGESSSTISVSGGSLSIIVNGGTTISVSNIIPSPNAIATKTITITGTNTTTLEMPYTMALIIDSNTFSTGTIKYTLDSTNTSSNGKIIKSIVTQTNIATSTSTITLGSGKFATGTNRVHTYVLKLYFPESGSNQNNEQGKSIGAHIEISASEATVPIPAPTGWEDAVTGTLLKALSDGNTITAPLTSPGRVISTSEEAVLAYTADDYGTSYYFRGAIANNYIKFANMCWRIVRVTGNGAIKLVLYNSNFNSVANPCDISQDGATKSFATDTFGDYSVSTFNNSSNTNGYIGFMYGAPGSDTYAAEHANTNKSALLTYLETWYTSKLSSFSSYLADTIWCNDKSMSTASAYLGYDHNITYYKTYQRLAPVGTAAPSLVCPNDANGGKLSKLTADETTYGNASLSYKAGLLTADEVAYAGGINGATNSTYYLAKNASGNNWSTLSPSYYDSNTASVWFVAASTVLTIVTTTNNNAIRPAVSLIATVNVTGVGTSANPYVVVA